MPDGYAEGLYVMGTVAAAVGLVIFVLRLLTWVLKLLGLRSV